MLTVEPGLYFQADDDLVPEELRGIGVRIEDDVLVTATGARNLSDGLPRTRRRRRDLAGRPARGRPPPARLSRSVEQRGGPAPPYSRSPRDPRRRIRDTRRARLAGPARTINNVTRSTDLEGMT